jgi:hypothetical protein
MAKYENVNESEVAIEDFPSSSSDLRIQHRRFWLPSGKHTKKYGKSQFFKREINELNG